MAYIAVDGTVYCSRIFAGAHFSSTALKEIVNPCSLAILPFVLVEMDCAK